MKGPVPRYVVAETILNADTLCTVKELNSSGRAASNGGDIAMACCEVTLALSVSDLPTISLNPCLRVLETNEALGHGQFDRCDSLFDSAVEMMRPAIRSQEGLQLAALGLSSFFSSFAPMIYSIAPHLLFGDTQNCRDNKGNRYRARIRVARKGPSASCLLLEWGNNPEANGLLITGERFLESLLQIGALWQGAAESAHEAHGKILAKSA